jgi:hypothetical protein
MSEDREDLAPTYFQANPRSRDFPAEWKDVWFRRRAKIGQDGIARYQCPMCKKCFDHRDIGFLQGDHIWPYSLFGETAWENYRLICGSCNAAKRDYIDSEIQRLLGCGEFRRIIRDYLSGLVATGQVKHELVLNDPLGSAP